MLAFLLQRELQITAGYCRITSVEFSETPAEDPEVLYDFVPLDADLMVDYDLRRTLYIFDGIPLTNAIIERYQLLPEQEIRCVRWEKSNLYHYEPVDIEVI